MTSGDTDSQAIFSLVAGIASMMFVLFGVGTILETVGLIGGVLALRAAVQVLRETANHPKLAVTGAVTGTIAVSGWLLIMACRMAAAVLNWVF
jgi:hypothetical protein